MAHAAAPKPWRPEGAETWLWNGTEIFEPIQISGSPVPRLSESEEYAFLTWLKQVEDEDQDKLPLSSTWNGDAYEDFHIEIANALVTASHDVLPPTYDALKVKYWMWAILSLDLFDAGWSAKELFRSIEDKLADGKNSLDFIRSSGGKPISGREYGTQRRRS